MTASNPIRVGPFPFGENNRRSPRDMVEKTAGQQGRFARAIVNADVHSEGRVTRRRGFTQALAMTDAMGAVEHADGALVIDNGQILFVRQQNGGLQAEVLGACVPGRRPAFCDVPAGTLLSDEDTIQLITPENAVRAWTLPQPTFSCTQTTGALPPGLYRVSVAYRADDGALHAAPEVQAIDVTTGGILVSDLPSTFPSGATVVVGMSRADGSELMEVMEFSQDSAPTLPITLAVAPSDGAEFWVAGLQPMPAGRFMDTLGGRVLSAVGNAVFFSEPFSGHVCARDRSYVLFEHPVTLLASLETGTFIAAGETYWLPGDIDGAEMLPQLPYDAVPYSLRAIPNQNKVWWMSEKGIIVGDQSGEVKNIQEANNVAPHAQAGASMFVEQNGLRQMLTTLFGAEQSRAAASSFMDAEIVRRNTA